MAPVRASPMVFTCKCVSVTVEGKYIGASEPPSGGGVFFIYLLFVVDFVYCFILLLGLGVFWYFLVFFVVFWCF